MLYVFLTKGNFLVSVDEYFLLFSLNYIIVIITRNDLEEKKNSFVSLCTTWVAEQIR